MEVPNTNLSMYSFLKANITDKSLEKINYYGKSFSAEEFFSEIDKLAEYLIKRIPQGGSVGICLPNIPQALIAFYAINKIGAIANIIHPKTDTVALINILEQTNTRYVFVFDRFMYKHSKELTEHGIMSIGCSFSYYCTGKYKMARLTEPLFYTKNVLRYESLLKSSEIYTERNVAGTATAVYLHSSGTTGDPKTVRLSSYAFNELAVNVLSLVKTKAEVLPSDGMLMALPMFHGFGLGICAHLMLYCGRVILLPMFKANEAAKLLNKERVEMISGVPNMYRRLADSKYFKGDGLSNLKLLFCGGDKLEIELKQRFEKILYENGSNAKLMEGYGLSETASVVTINVDGKDDGSLGVPLPNVEIKIENGDEGCKENEVGEIVVTTTSVMNGYLNGKSNLSVDKKGRKWLHTGDLGYLDADGKLFYKGREKRLIKIGGVNIFPQEIEKVAESFKDVVAACAVRIKYDNKPAIKLIVVTEEKKLPYTLKSKLENAIREQILPYAVPREIVRVAKLQYTPLGKVDYKFYEDMENK